MSNRSCSGSIQVGRKLPVSLIKNDVSFPEIAGVYFLYNEEGDLIYIGKSMDVIRRLREHLEHSSFQFSSFRIKPVPLGSLFSVERKLIRKHKPPRNIEHNPNKTARRGGSSWSRIKKIFSHLPENFTEKELDSLIEEYGNVFYWATKENYKKVMLGHGLIENADSKQYKKGTMPDWLKNKA